MPSFTLAEIMSQATTRAGRRADIDASDVSFMVNMSYQEIAQMTEHKLTEKIATSSTTSGENRVDLPTDFNSPINLSITSGNNQNINSGRTLTRRGASFVDARGFTPVGTPSSYVLYNDFLELHPSPDSGYSLQLRYRSFVTDLLTLTDVPSVSTPWRTAILYLAEAEIRAFTNDIVGEAAARQRAFNYIQALRNDEARRQLDESGMGIAHSYVEPRRRSRRSFDIV